MTIDKMIAWFYAEGVEGKDLRGMRAEFERGIQRIHKRREWFVNATKSLVFHSVGKFFGLSRDVCGIIGDW